MKMKKLIAISLMLSLACVLVLIVGCSTKNTSSSSSSSTNSTSSSSPSSSTSQSTASSWPDNANTANVPRPTFAASSTSVLDSGGITAITYKGISSEDSATYLQQLKDAGFTKVEADSNVVGTVSYVARNVNTQTHLSYSFTSSSGLLTVSLDRIGV